MKTGTLKDFKVALKKGIQPDSFKSWFSRMATDFEFVDGAKTLTLIFKTPFIADYVQDKFSQKIDPIALAIFGENVFVKYRCDPQLDVQEADSKKKINRGSNAKEPHQKSLFIPDIGELSIRDDINLMEIAPFTLNAKTESRNKIVYKDVSGLNFTITALDDENGVNHGLPRARDYDLVMMMQGCTAMSANDYYKAMDVYEEDIEAGRKARPPEPVGSYFEPYVSDILEFCKVGRGGKQIDGLLEAFQRLDNTKISLTRSSSNRKRVGSYNLIDGWEITSSTQTGKIQKIKMGIPSWTHSLIVSSRRPAILKLDPAFMDLRSPILRALYRICRLKGSQQNFEMPFSELHKRMGSATSLPDFVKTFNSAIKSYKNKPFFEWNIAVEGIRDKRKLVAILLDKNEQEQLEKQ